MMDLRALRYFVAVVEAGSLTAAAQGLRLSQPSLSVAISRLETEVGVQLLTRSPRGVEPTSAGRFLLDASSRVLGEVDEIGTTLRRFGAGLVGTISIAAVPVLMWSRIPRLLREFSRVVPDVEVRPVDPPPWKALELLQQRRVDVAAILVSDPERFAQRHEEAFDIADWGEVPLVAALPPEQAPASADMELREFERATLVLPHRTAAVPSLPEAVEEALRRQAITPRAIRSVETIQSGMPLIEAGLAWGILPDPDGESLARFGVAVRQLVPSAPPLRALVLSRKGGVQRPEVARLLAFISENR
ncbi:LysR family transcriptional regulator [Leucobacter chromiireducens]|uniref:LysR family transcriptional regulator n=1 Tax=Leucobacter chromiireducens subsp. solipictus TaxID=398235 RepID=A0ABS1SI22_9MICO|nr:LysR family transcriptional regulator [Leucobacter chromiireducens]MBL3680214.1 LysR family transcriptional regulator [Leucobacter chromiireducens subsp. solipictus]